jgi:hypothetical protein
MLDEVDTLHVERNTFSGDELLSYIGFGMFGRSGAKEFFRRVRMTYIEVVHIAHEDIRQRAMAFGVAISVMALNE